MQSREYPASIIVPLLDQQDSWLEQCLKSALTQTIRSEVIVVSSARTRSSNFALMSRLGQEFKNLLVVERRPGEGFPRAINTGIEMAHADRVGLLMSDDWLEPDAVELTIEYETDIVSSGMTGYAADGITDLPEISFLPNRLHFERIVNLDEKASYLSHFFLFRMTALKKIGLVDETLGDYPGIDDFDMPWTLLEHNASVSIVEKKLYNYRDHDGDRLTLKKKEDAIAGLERILKKHQVSEADRKRILASHTPWYGEQILRVHERMVAAGKRSP